MRKIAVEDGLQNVKDFLQNKGYSVDCLPNNKSNLGSYDAIVVTGQSSNFLGMQDTATKSSVISAQGLTPEDIQSEIERRLH